MPRKTIFTINNEIIIEENKDLTGDEIIDIKRLIACECDVKESDVDVLFINITQELSDYDVSNNGEIYKWNMGEMNPVGTGIKSKLVEGSDEYLDAFNEGRLIDSLEIF